MENQSLEMHSIRISASFFLPDNDKWNVVLWMDHRAQAEADFINSTKHKMLRYVGGKISLEMETPKMLWLKKNLPNSWKRAKLLFDLPDFLTWKATGSESRYKFGKEFLPAWIKL